MCACGPKTLQETNYKQLSLVKEQLQVWKKTEGSVKVQGRQRKKKQNPNISMGETNRVNTTTDTFFFFFL